MNNGQKWLTDEPLRAGMHRIRDAVNASLPLIHEGSYGPAEFSVLADSVEQQIEYIAMNCKLPEEADLQLHLALARMFDGIDALKGTADQEKGVVAIAEALNAYGEHFDHPDWKPIAVDPH